MTTATTNFQINGQSFAIGDEIPDDVKQTLVGWGNPELYFDTADEPKEPELQKEAEPPEESELDGEPIKPEVVADLKVDQLREQLGARGLDTSGLKDDLVARLTAAVEAEQ